MQIKEQADLSAHNSFGFRVTAEYWVQVQTEQELLQALDFAEQKHLPILLLGAGSNLILADYIPGLIINYQAQGYSLINETEQQVLLDIEAGHNWHQLVEETLKKNWSGLENLALIPGTVGAAPVQNIGAYGVELEDVFQSLTAYNRESKQFVEFQRKDCLFAYRNSIFKQQLGRYIITSVQLLLDKKFTPKIAYGGLAQALEGQELTAQNVFKEVVAMRQAKLPNPDVLGNVGSFFENPVVSQVKYQRLLAIYPNIVAYPLTDIDKVKLSAAWLIDQAGWKGYRLDQVGVFDKQALVLINYGQAGAEDILALSAKIQASVWAKYEIKLVSEPRIYPAQ